ncbi:MAG: hypothetical protein FWE88_04720 [Phycisphaerae bacterium]|nr:hypothetical protein [Phycisphaerae bacterium]
MRKRLSTNGVVCQWITMAACLMAFSAGAQRGETQPARTQTQPAQPTTQPGAAPVGLEGKHSIAYAVFSPDGRRVAAGAGLKTARLWDAATGKELAVLRHDGHEEYDVRVLAFSADSARLVTVVQNNARVWNGADGTLIAEFSGHQLQWSGVAFSPDGKRIVTALDYNDARLCDVDTGKELAILRKSSLRIGNAMFSPDSKRILADPARVLNAETGDDVATLHEHTGPADAAAFSPDGKRVATVVRSLGLLGRNVRVWNADTGEELFTLKGHDKYLANTAVFSPDGKRILTTADDYTARVWDAATGKELAVMDHPIGPVVRGAFCADSKRVLTTANDILRVWDADTGKKVAVMPGGEKIGHLVAVSADWKRVLVRPGDNADRANRVLDVVFADPKTDPDDLEEARLNEKSIALRGHERSIHSVVFSPDSKRILTRSGDDTTRLWDVATGNELMIVRHEQAVWRKDKQASWREDAGVVFGLKGHLMISTRDEAANVIRVRDVDNDKELAALQAPEAAVSSVTFSPDGKRALAKVDDLTARVWDVATGKELLVLGPPPDPFSREDRADRPDRRWGMFDSAVFSPTGKHIVTICGYGIASRSTAHGNFATLYNAETGKEIPLLYSEKSRRAGEDFLHASFSPDGKRLIIAGYGDGVARVWNTEDGKEILALDGHEREAGYAAFTRGAGYAAFTPDGKRVVTAGMWWDNDIRIWNAADGKEITVLRVPGKPERPPHIVKTTLSPDGKQIVAFSHDSTVRIWSIADGKERAVLRIPASQDNIPVISPDGQRVVTFSIWGKTARVWNIDALTEKSGGK